MEYVKPSIDSMKRKAASSGKPPAIWGVPSAVGNNRPVIAHENLKPMKSRQIGVYRESDGDPLGLIGFVEVHTS